MKLSKRQMIEMMFSEYKGTPIFEKLVKRMNRKSEGEFMNAALQAFHQPIQIARKNTYLIG